eukprot:TRINITY_DN825_c0_g1_i1.p1 TRINITY_DN825_c0_g1~~TRINITY_DN825_c0_g1_i1.p1  ORF type:complete len:128 (-),score=25.84 TRINITY_DN825_c0_g1_i1:53-436(-)
MSSWQTYVDSNLVGTGRVAKAAIVGLDGNTWATSPGFMVPPNEVVSLTNLYKNPSETFSNGINFAGKKYLAVKADNRSIYGKKGPGGCVIVKTGKALLVAIYEEGQQPGNAATVVEKVADYLLENGY